MRGCERKHAIVDPETGFFVQRGGKRVAAFGDFADQSGVQAALFDRIPEARSRLAWAKDWAKLRGTLIQLERCKIVRVRVSYEVEDSDQIRGES
jgi:hypothetical protein